MPDAYFFSPESNEELTTLFIHEYSLSIVPVCSSSVLDAKKKSLKVMVSVHKQVVPNLGISSD